MVDATFKICIFGDGGVGKTTLTKRYLTGLFSENEKITIGVDFHIKILSVEGKIVQLQIWDFAGENRFRFMLPTYARGSNGGIFMYDITRWPSLKNMDDWLKVFKDGACEGGNNAPIAMVGGKLDLDHKRSIERGDAIQKAYEKGMCAFAECSAATGQNVEIVFEALAEIMLENAGMNI
jgi:small GTP-binding protein